MGKSSGKPYSAPEVPPGVGRTGWWGPKNPYSIVS